MKKVLCFISVALLLAACTGPEPTSPTPSSSPKVKTWLDYTAKDLTALYGAPDFVRKENGSEVWRYDVGACRIFFFLYQNGGKWQIRHLESQPAGVDQPIEQNCFNAFKLRMKKS